MSIWDEQYLTGQGRYFPAEELIRFLGRTYGPVVQRRGMGKTAVEIGCGVGGNIKALAEWGFFTYGLEYSLEAIKLAQRHACMSMFSSSVDYRPYRAPDTIKLPAKSVNLVLDIQTLQHLDEEKHIKTYQEVHRILAPGGRFFTIHWVGMASARSNIFPTHPELDACDSLNVAALIRNSGFMIHYNESVSKSYRHDIGEWAIIEAEVI